MTNSTMSNVGKNG